MPHARLAAIALAATATFVGTAPADELDELAEKLSTPYLTLEDPRAWTLTSQVQLLSTIDEFDVPGGEPGDRLVLRRQWPVDEASFVFPVVRRSASSVAQTDLSNPDDQSWFSAELFLDGRLFTDAPTLIGGYHSMGEYVRLEAEARLVDDWRLRVEQRSVSFETVFHEEEALKVGWPESGWPPEAASTMGPQQFVTEENPTPNADGAVAGLLKEWIGNNDPKSIAPITLAKYLTGKVQDHVRVIRPSTERVRLHSTGSSRVRAANATEGVTLRGSELTAAEGEGSEHDMACLLAAVMRGAGLPARIVIGYDDNESGQSRELRSWVEFCLYDEPNAQITWIPVDIARIKRSSSRSKPLDQPWKYFGTHDELDDVVPFSFHFHPPTTVRAYNSPAFYGWWVAPEPPDFADQTINFFASRTPKQSSRRRGR